MLQLVSHERNQPVSRESLIDDDPKVADVINDGQVDQAPGKSDRIPSPALARLHVDHDGGRLEDVDQSSERRGPHVAIVQDSLERRPARTYSGEKRGGSAHSTRHPDRAAQRSEDGRSREDSLPHDHLRRTGLIRPYPASDLVLLAELALRGELREVPERLFERRIHSESATKGERDAEEIAAWFDPSERSRSRVGAKGRSRVGAKGRVFWGSNSAILTSADLPLRTRLAGSAGFTGGWIVKRLRVQASRLRNGTGQAQESS